MPSLRPHYLLFSLLLSACAPSWTVAVQARPNPFSPTARFAVVPFDARRIAENHITQGGDFGSQDPIAFQHDEAALDDAYASGLEERGKELGVEVSRAPSEGSAFFVRPTVRFAEPGAYEPPFAAQPSRMEIIVDVTAPNGRLLDELTLSHGTMATVATSGTGRRLRDDARALGELTAEYLATRVPRAPH